ncbi:IS110 family transposase [Rhodococcus globerulus]|uniref:IS110 family transposase n=1 Tax=Rhodococcus globerulus TaxID=33008 RepID=UPI000A456E51
MNTSYAVFCGIEVGKGEHHAVGLDASGDRLYDKPLPNDEMKLRAVFDNLAQCGPVLVIVDQRGHHRSPAGHRCQGLRPRRRILARTVDAQDRRPLPRSGENRRERCIHHCRYSKGHAAYSAPVDTGDEVLAELGVLVGFDDDLAGEATRISNRIRGLLTGIHPALERVVGPRISHPAVLEILTRCGGPNGIRVAGKRKLTNLAVKHAPRMGARLADQIIAALSTQTVIVPGSNAAEIVLPKLAESLKETLLQRKSIGDDVERMLDDHPLSPVLISMPGIGVRTGARILLEVGDGSAFKSAGHLAAYAGIAPVTHRSGSSIRGEHPA